MPQQHGRCRELHGVTGPDQKVRGSNPFRRASRETRCDQRVSRCLRPSQLATTGLLDELATNALTARQQARLAAEDGSENLARVLRRAELAAGPRAVRRRRDRRPALTGRGN